MKVKTRLAESLRESVRPDEGQVPAFVFADPEVYRLELERIFLSCWIFVAHESEIPSAGDYVSRNMGEQSVIVARGEDGQVRVFLNLCRHRGMRICRTDLGNSSHFRCPYHGFTYRNTGELTGVPFQKNAYGDVLDKSQLGLIEAEVDTYRGLVFATWDRHAEPFDEYLGNIKWYLDLAAGRAEMEIIGPPHKWEVASNWKLPAENFMSDSYHTAHTHASIAKLDLVPSSDFGRSGYQIYAGNGHGLGLGVQSQDSIFPEELMPEFRETLSEEQLAFLMQTKNLHGTVFPNLSFLIPTPIKFESKLITHTSIRQWQPIGADKIEIYSWFLVEKGAPEWWKRLSRRAYIHTFGPSGIFEQDDTENWSDITSNSRSPVVVSSQVALNYQMGTGKTPVQGFPGPGEVYEGKYSEANARAFYRRWLELMLGD